MSWHFSWAMVEDCSAQNCLVGEPCAEWKSIRSALGERCSDRMKDTFHRSQFGMMYVPLTDAHGEAVLMSYLEGFPVKTLAMQIPPQKESVDREADSGGKWHESLVKFDPVTSLWKTRQLSLDGGSESFLENWPEWGIMRDGESWALSTPATATDDTESSLLHPTPTKSDAKGASSGIKSKLEQGSYLKYWLHKRFATTFTTYPHPELAELVMGWPIGFSDLAPLETAKFRQWFDSHGKSSAGLVLDSPDAKP